MRAVALPGHTRGSMGYVVEGERVLLSGDAVTPCMTLFYDDSTLDVDSIMTGHYDHEFVPADLAGWRELALWAKDDRGMRWQNISLPELRGCLHVMSEDGVDPDSPEFRALIERPKPRVRSGRRRHSPPSAMLMWPGANLRYASALCAMANSADARQIAMQTMPSTNMRGNPPAESITRLQNTAATALMSEPAIETRE